MADAAPAAVKAAPGQRSTARLLAAAWAVLTVYASLYPFSGWRSTGVPWNVFITAPFSPYWTWFDVISNVLGYMPLGFLLTLGWLHDGGRWQRRTALLLTWLCGSALSFCMEGLQVWLPGRVASNLDWMLNSGGSLLGGCAAWLLHRQGAVGHWSSFRQRWLVADARIALILLLLWPVALLYPAQLPFGLGQVLERLENQLYDWFTGTPFAELLPIRAIELQPILPAMETVAVALGLLAPLLLALGVLQQRWQRVPVLLLVWLGGILVTALAAALTSGIPLAWDWLWPPAQGGVIAAALLALPCLWLPTRACRALALLALLAQLYIVNNAGASVYHDWALDRWRDGSFIHFYGLTEWIAWLWPYAALTWLAPALLRPVPSGDAPDQTGNTS